MLLNVFFCPDPVHHRDLPSFPTRRSSDLLKAVGSFGGNNAPREIESAAIASPSGNWVSMVWPNMVPVARTAKSGCSARDRKSTRLNSSHRCISYAVFCLKKKNQTHITQ